MADDTYNGWTNRETWAWFLHMTNDQGLCETLEEWARETIEDDPDATPLQVGESIRDAFDGLRDEITHDDGSTVTVPQFLSLMDQDVGSYWRIDWEEIGEAALEMIDEIGR